LKDPLNTKPLDGVKDMPQVSEVVDQVDDLRGATNNLNAIRNATFVVAFVQAIAAVFLIVNMVQIAAYSRRQETTIMRMVGATRWFTQAPFVLEAVLASFVGSLVATGGLILGKEFVLDKTLKSLYDSRLIARLTLADIGMVSPIIIIVGVVFAAITAQATLRWYVRD
jgi:cell division protein ftsX